MDTSKSHYFFVDDDEQLSKKVQEYLVTKGYQWGAGKTYLPAYGFIDATCSENYGLRLNRWSRQKDYNHVDCMEFIQIMKNKGFIEMNLTSLLVPKDLFEL